MTALSRYTSVNVESRIKKLTLTVASTIHNWGVHDLPDKAFELEVANLKALQVRQQLQLLRQPIANSASHKILSFFS